MVVCPAGLTSFGRLSRSKPRLIGSVWVAEEGQCFSPRPVLHPAGQSFSSSHADACRCREADSVPFRNRNCCFFASLLMSSGVQERQSRYKISMPSSSLSRLARSIVDGAGEVQTTAARSPPSAPKTAMLACEKRSHVSAYPTRANRFAKGRSPRQFREDGTRWRNAGGASLNANFQRKSFCTCMAAVSVVSPRGDRHDGKCPPIRHRYRVSGSSVQRKSSANCTQSTLAGPAPIRPALRLRDSMHAALLQRGDNVACSRTPITS
jgi:hypothetical protein